MSQAEGVTLQINVAPTDLPHAVCILPHQLRQWAAQVDEIVFSFDLHRTRYGGRFGYGWEERLAPMEQLLEDLCQEYPNASVIPVGYAPEDVHKIESAFTAGAEIPAKDTKGAPVYPYFHGLYAADNDLVLHLDSDIMFGGCSQTWVTEARLLLTQHPDVLTCSPLPGPPRQDGTLTTQQAEPFQHDSPAFRFATFSTRVFLIDRKRLRDRLLPLELSAPTHLVSHLKARLHGNPLYRAAELSVSDAMRQTGLSRVDFLGTLPGMWSLHPPFRSQAFYKALPRLIAQIESGDIPGGQRGDYELNDCMFDWSRARLRAMLRRLWA